MPRHLFLSDNHTWPLERDPMRVTNEAGGLEYEGRHQSFRAAFLVDAQGETVASVRRCGSTWAVELEGHRFDMRPAWFRSRWDVIGGPWDGATLRGNVLYYLRWEAHYKGSALARATGPVVIARRAHRVEVLSNRLDDERFIVAALLAMRMRKDDQNAEAP